jgi:NapH/MauN family ferredoxin-type protein
MNKILSKIKLRTLVQAAILIVVLALALIHQFLGIEKAAPIDAYCPFGAVESFFTLIFKGEFLKRIFSSSFVLMAIFLVATLFLGRVFCGYFCPLGAIQEWLRSLGKKLGIKKDIELPATVDKYLRFLKYFSLAAVIYFSFYLNDLIFRNYDPYNALMHLGQEFSEKIVAYVLLFIIIIVSLFSKSWWCRYLCPLGAFFAVIKKISFFNIKRDEKTCSSCGLCNKVCPANLDIKNKKIISDADCISCGNCTNNCSQNSLSFNVLGKKITKKNFNLLVLFLVILPLIIFPFTPIWKTKAESNIVNVKGEVNVADIRGSNTLEYVVDTTGVPLLEFQKKLGLPKGVDTKMKLKEIGLKYNLKNIAGETLETEDFRSVVDNYLNSEKIELISEPDCPFGKTECEFPGECGLYVDGDKNRICDHSE